jgi:hypoxanthine phosphoribosyltransferase
LDVVITMDRAFIFGADLIRAIDAPVVLHFVREAVQDVQHGGKARREVFFENRDAVAAAQGNSEFKGRDVLLVDAVIDSGITQDFLLRRIGEGRPRSLRMAVLLDKTPKRRVALEPDYFGFRTASNQLWAGYGLAASNGTGRNGKNLVASAAGGSKRKAGRANKK